MAQRLTGAISLLILSTEIIDKSDIPLKYLVCKNGIEVLIDK